MKYYIKICVLLACAFYVALFIAGCSNNKKSPSVSSIPTLNMDPSPTPNGKPLTGLKICIDPGHQSQQNTDKEPVAPWDLQTLKTKAAAGTTGIDPKIPEYIVTLQISEKLKEQLISKGAEVLMTRETPFVNISNKERAEMGNNFGANLSIRIHCNGYDNTSVNGIEIYTRGKGDATPEYKKSSEYDYQMANELISYISKSTGSPARSIFQTDIYTGINWSTVPCMLIETGYMSNPDELKKLVTDDYQNKIAQGITTWFIEGKTLKR